jgi:hypothetical protein
MRGRGRFYHRGHRGHRDEKDRSYVVMIYNLQICLCVLGGKIT